MPGLLRKLGWVSVVIFVFEGVVVVAGPDLSNGIAAFLGATADKSVLLSQGAALLMVSAGVLLARQLFSVEDGASTDSGSEDGQNRDENLAGNRVRLFAAAESGEESQLVVETASGKQVRLMVMAEGTTSSESAGSDLQQDDQGQQRFARFCSWVVAILGFIGALFVLTDENPILALLILVPQVYGSAIAYSLIGIWSLWRMRRRTMRIHASA